MQLFPCSNKIATAFANNQISIKPEREHFSLPEKPSELLQFALNDLDNYLESHQLNRLYLRTFISKCTACLAGAIIAQSLQFENQTLLDHVYFPMDFDYETNRKLQAIDLFRLGELERGYTRIKRAMPNGMDIYYDSNRLTHFYQTPNIESTSISKHNPLYIEFVEMIREIIDYLKTFNE